MFYSSLPEEKTEKSKPKKDMEEDKTTSTNIDKEVAVIEKKMGFIHI